MKKIFISFAGAIILSLNSFSAAFTQPLIVAVDTAFVPFEFKQGDKYVGFDIDLWDLIATELDAQWTSVAFYPHYKPIMSM